MSITHEHTSGSAHHRFCSFEAFDFVLSLFYLFLFVWSVILATDKNREWSLSHSLTGDHNNKGNGVLYYLGCTALLCFARCMSFALSLYKNEESDNENEPSTETNYKDDGEYCRSFQDASFQWEVHGSEDPAARGSYWISLMLVLLSTVSTALFFSSYTYFAHSLTRVLDAVVESHTVHDRMLFGSNANAFSIVGKWIFGFSSSPSEEQDAPRPASAIYHNHHTGSILSGRATWLSSSLLTLNGLVWISVVIVWTSLTIRNKYYAVFADYIGQLVISVAVLTLAAIFSIHFTRALWFLRELRGTGTKVTHLTQVLKLRHVLGVILVCTLCFVVRAVLILTRLHLSALGEDVYFLVFEAAPTLYMLYALLRSGHGEIERRLRSSGGGGNSVAELDDEEEGVFAGRSCETSRLLGDPSFSNAKMRSSGGAGTGTGASSTSEGLSEGRSCGPGGPGGVASDPLRAFYYQAHPSPPATVSSFGGRTQSHESLMALSVDPRDDGSQLSEMDSLSFDSDGREEGLSLGGEVSQVRAPAHLLDYL